MLKSTAGRYPDSFGRLGEPSATIPVRLGAWENRRPLSWFVQGLAVGRYPGLPPSGPEAVFVGRWYLTLKFSGLVGWGGVEGARFETERSFL